MAYHVTHWTGECERGYPPTRFGELLDELLDADEEHPDVSVTHETEWAVTIYRTGLLVLENLRSGNPLHIDALDRPSVLRIMTAIAEGRIADAQSAPWLPGYR